MGLRVLVGKQAGGGFDQRIWRRRRHGAGRARRGDGAGRAGGSVRGLGRAGAAGEDNFPTSTCSIRDAAGRRRRLKRWRAAPKQAGLRGQGRHQVGRRVGFRRHRRHGADDQPRLLRRLSRLAPRRVDDRDRRRRHRRWSATTIIPRRCIRPISTRRRRSAAPPASGPWSGSIRARPPTCKVPVVFDRRIPSSLVGHLVSAINGSAIARKTSFLKDKLGERMFAPGINIIDDPLRRRGLRSRPFDAEGVAGQRMALIEDGVLQDLAARLRDRARTWARDHRPRARGASSTPSPGADQSASRSRHADARAK